MADEKRFFDDSGGYERAMGRCSRVAGKEFLEWLSMPDGLKWLDVGCGTGSFTELVLDRHAPRAISAIDPSEGQIAFAKTKRWADQVDFRVGDAMSLPYDTDVFDVAVMALVIQYIPDPARAMSEITRVVKPRGTVATYTWPGSGDAHPMQPMSEAIDALGISRPRRPGNQFRSVEALGALFAASGLVDMESRIYEIRLIYQDFDDYWSSQTADTIRHISDADADRLKAVLRETLPMDGSGQISYSARVNAVSARLP